ncbi:MAG: SNF2-related protein [Terricaulis sp.]
MKVLNHAKSEKDFEVYQAALEWGLTEPIVIESEADLKSAPRWAQRFEPFQHQVQNLITFCRRLPVTLLADDVGLGKTISAGLVASELIARNRIQKILIVAPKLLGPQWKEELASKFDIAGEVVTGSDLINAEPEDVGAVITTYHSAREHLEKIPEDRFDMLVLDEAHKLRNLFGVEKAPQVAKVFQRALRRRRFRFVLMLTATPIQNRLWDIYSLVELLTGARGHENPFGSDGLFARRFIGDSRETARVLKPDAREEFRKIVYGYMSRVRRGDAKLDFPERKIEQRKVLPSAAEKQLIATIAEPIQKLDRLSQINILKALTSSPRALMAELTNRARKGSVPPELAAAVRAIVTPLRTTAKLEGLGQLVAELQRQNASGWRMVVFTTRLETQTSIQLYLEECGLKVGIINGSSGARNQETIARFKADPPEVRVIVSTEAGSEGVNLQVANVLVNFDLPWNPMIVEQRIGRVQRLGSMHKNVVIYNMTLAGTFEEYIVGRLMAKLQMASDAIGDIESLLEASGVGAEGDEGDGFEDRMRELVLAALAGMDMHAAAEKIAASIDAATKTLEAEKANIDATLGDQAGYEYVGPRTPTLSSQRPSIEFEPFLQAAFASLGGSVAEVSPGVLRATLQKDQEYLRLREGVEARFAKAPLYAPGSPAFLRFVDRLTVSGLHRVDDADADYDVRARVDQVARDWVGSFGAVTDDAKIVAVQRLFTGEALVRVRSSTQHDSYERLVSVTCAPLEHASGATLSNLNPLDDLMLDPSVTGLRVAAVMEAARRDPDVSEFNRFYLERRAQEVEASRGDARKRQKLEDEFTPRTEATLVALSGRVTRHVTANLRYLVDGVAYASDISVIPHQNQLTAAPVLASCELTRLSAPTECLEPCEMSGKRVLRHRLIRSEVSNRYVLPEYGVRCSLSGKQMCADEGAKSDVTQEVVDKGLLKTCALTRNKVEPSYIGTCEFTAADILKARLARSDVSGKFYREDERVASGVSGQSGHRSEFISCYETRQPMLPNEAERCESTGKLVRPGVLEACAVTKKRVLPNQLEPSMVSGARALSTLLVESSISRARLLESEAVRSAYQKFCAPVEAVRCEWGGELIHPDDVRTCSLLGLRVHFQYVCDRTNRLQAMADLLNGSRRTSDRQAEWVEMQPAFARALKQNCKVEAARLSPDSRRLAICVERKTLLGLQTQYAGGLYSFEDHALVGQVARVKRDSKGDGGIRVL